MANRVIRGVLRRLRGVVSKAETSIRSLAAGLPAIRVIGATVGGAAIRRIGRLIASSRDSARLRVGVDIRPFYEPLTGIGWYLHEILAEMSKRDDVELVLFGDAVTTEDGPVLHVALPGDLRVTSFQLENLAVSSLARVFARAMYPALIWLEGCDLLFGANYFLPRPMSAAANRRVVTVHDFTFRRYPELLQHETLDNLNREMQREIVRADAVICVSEATRRDLLDLYPIDPRRAVTIHSGLRQPLGVEEPVRELPARYILFVSTIEPRKNLEALLEAFERLLDDDRYDGDLVVVGKVGWKADSIVSRMAQSRWRARIHHLDYLRRPHLVHVYRHAEVFVLPSHYEGFGFPLLEAMSCGIPSIAARTSSLPEVGGDAVLYFEPDDRDGLLSRLVEILDGNTVRREMADRATKRATEFRWERCADETIGVLRRVAGQ